MSSKSFWGDLAKKGPIIALAPMDGYCDSPYRQVMKMVAPDIVTFAEFYSADGLVHSKTLAGSVLPHNPLEKPVVFQIFGKDPEMFAKAAIMIEQSGAAGVDINMGCPAKKVVKSGHGSSLMINRDTAFRIVEEMTKAVSIPVSVKTRLGWEDPSLLIDFARGLESAGANLISVHGRTYKQAFTGRADFSSLFALKRALTIPVLANGDIMSYDDGIEKIKESFWHPDIAVEGQTILDGCMIGRASFGNPWCFLPGNTEPSLSEVLDAMLTHGQLLSERKGRKGMLEARKHLVQYLHSLPGVKEYRKALVSVESSQDIERIIETIRSNNKDSLHKPLSTGGSDAIKEGWGDSCSIPTD